VDGVLGDITPEKIEFKIDSVARRIDRARVAGMIYYRPEKKTGVLPRCIVYGRSGLRAHTSRAHLSEDTVRMATLDDVELEWPLADIYLADFSAGKIKYLSDIEQASARWTPLVGSPTGAGSANEFGQPRRDKSAYGGPLAILEHDENSSVGSGYLRQFGKGLSLRSRTEMIFRLPPGYRQFSAVAGIEPATSSTGNIQLAILADDRVLFEADVAGDQPPHKIELDITDAKRLKIVVDFGKNLDTGDWLNLCDARLVK
jgi:hypothetical protein